MEAKKVRVYKIVLLPSNEGNSFFNGGLFVF